MKRIYLFLLTLLFAGVTHAQVTGPKTIGVDYATIAAAVTDLNANGVGAGGATINVPAGYTETAPSGGYLIGSATLNASLTAANQLTIIKSGAGANPVISSFTGGSSTATDGVIKLLGTDYVRIDGINIIENPANTGAALMEWGIALVQRNGAAPFDGCQFNTIQNCTITLNRLNPNGSQAIVAAHNTATSVTALTITAVGDLHSNNKVYSNNISNCTFAVFFAGFAAVTPFTLFDQNNDVGGTTAATGNTISNTTNALLFNAFGIYMANNNNANASNNTIGLITGPTSGAVAHGIYFFGTNNNVTANNNNITVGQTIGTGITAGIYAPNTGNVTATGNTITFSDIAGSGSHYGVYSAGILTTNISNNTFRVAAAGSMTGLYGFVYNATNAATGLTVSDNRFENISINTTGTTYLIYNSTATPTFTINNNSTVGNFTRAGASGTVYGYYDFGSPTAGTATVTNNNFSNMSVAGSTAFFGVYQGTSTTQTEIVNNNTVSNITAGTGAMVGIQHSYGTIGSTANGNTVTNLSGGGAVTGLAIATSTASGGLGSTFSGNTIGNLSSTGASTVTGILHTYGTNTVIQKNKIYSLQSSNASGVVNGITFTASAAGTSTISNNLVGNLTATAASSTTDAVRGINITSTTAATALNVYYNTVYLNAASTGTNFSSSALFHTTSATATTSALNLRNNILYNNSTASGSGVISAYRRSSTTLTNYAATSSNNMFYAGAGATNYLYYDGTTGYTTIAATQAAVTPREAGSVTELSTPFLSTVGANANFLHINTAVGTVVESGGTPVAITDDYDGNTRNATTPDIGADEFAGIAPAACGGTPVAGTITGASNICQGQQTMLTLSGYTTDAGISVQWKSSTTSGGPYTNIPFATGVTYNTGVIPTGTTVYYVVTVTCANGGGNATTTQFSVTSNANPTIAVTPNAPAICSNGTGVALTASGASTYTWSPATGLSATTGTTVTANPAATTTYTVVGTSAAGCTGTTTVTVTVNPAPTAVTVTPATALLCSTTDPAVLLTATGGMVTATALSENFNAAPAGWTTTNTSTGGTPANAAWTLRNSPYAIWLETLSSNDASQFYLTNSDAQGSGSTTATTLVSPSFSTMGYTSLTLQFYHYFRFNAAGDAANVEVSTDGASWTGVQSYTSTTGTAGGFAVANINLNAYINNPTLYVRFRFAAAWGYGWAVDNVKVTGNAQGNITWTPTAGLFTDAGAATPYTGTATTTVYAKPSATQTYTATATLGTCTSTGSATVTVDPVIISAVLTQPSTCVAADGAITLTLSGGGGGYTFAWTGTGVNPTSQNQTGLTPGSYTVTVTGANTCATTQTFALAGPGGCSICPTIPNLTVSSAAVCQGTGVTITASGLTDMGVTYGITFKYSTYAVTDPYTEGTVIATVPNSALTSGKTVATTTATLTPAGNYIIYAVVTPLPLDPTCRPSKSVGFIVNPIPASNTIANQAVCNGSPTAAVNFSAASGTICGTAGEGGNVVLTAPVGTVITAINFASFGTPNGSCGSFTIGACHAANSVSIVSAMALGQNSVTIPATNAVFTDPCGGTPKRLYIQATYSPVTYNWTNSAPSIGLAASGSGNIPSFTATNATGAPVTGTITVTPSYTNGGTTCTGAVSTFTITVNPVPTVNAVANQSLCPGASTAAVNFTGAVTGTVYNWTNNNTSIGLAASGTGNIASFTAVNNGSTPQVATITVTPTYTNAGTTCTGTPISFTITVTPNPAITIVADPGTTVCAGDPTRLTVYEQGAAANITVTHSSSNAITTGNSVSCGTAVTTAVNSFWRAYSLPAFPAVTGNFTINSVAFGIESATGGAQNVTVRLYNQTGAAFPGGTRTQIASQVFSVPTSANSIFTATFTAPVTVPNTSTIVVELQTAGAVGTRFFIGSNAAAESGPSYLSAADCAIAAPTTTAAIGFPNMHIVMGLQGTVPGAGAIVTTGTFLWSPAAGLSSTTTNPVAASPATTTTYTVTTTTPGGCTRTASITLTVNQRPAITSQPSATTVCAGAPATFTAVGTGTGATLQWQYSTDGGVTWTNLTNTPPYSGVTTGTLTINPTTFAMNGYRYRLSVSGICPPTAFSNGAILTVNALPVVTITPAGPICGGVAGINGTLLTASSPTGGNFTWSPATGLYTNATATTAYVAGTPTATVYAAPSTNTTYTVTATNGTTGCTGTGTVTVNYTPPAPTVSPAAATICLGGIQPLTITSSLAPVTVTGNSGAINVLVPDGTGDPAISTINISGIPAGAVISNITVRFTMTHTWVGDMDINLVAPNAARLNLVGGLDGGTGSNGTANFTNTSFSSAGGATISGAPAPRTNIFAAEARAGYGPTGFEQTVNNWAALQTIPNGNWSLAMGDFGAGDQGTLTSWNIDITYGLPAGGIWSPATGLYTNAAATIPYVAGTPAVTVYASPAATTTYSVTVANGTCTSPARTVVVTVNTPLAITTQPVNQTVCTDKTATFTVVATGTAQTHNWQVSTDAGNTFTNITNGGVYSGANTATLTITAPPLSMNGYLYRDSISTAPCPSIKSATARLTVNPLPTVVISAAPYTALYPGLVTTLTSTVTPNAAAIYTWLRNGVAVAGATGPTLSVDADGLGIYTLRVQDVNGCVGTSNAITIRDSASGQLFIYPNPNNGIFQVRYYSVTGNTLARGVTVYDALGARVMVQNFTNTAPYSRMDLDLRKYGKGIYWIELADRNGNRLAMGRVIVQ